MVAQATQEQAVNEKKKIMTVLPNSTLHNADISSDVNQATTPKAKVKATYLKAKNTTTFPQHITDN